MERIIECVPNFSEGRNKEVINAIVASIEKSGGVKVLDVDPGEASSGYPQKLNKESKVSRRKMQISFATFFIQRIRMLQN